MKEENHWLNIIICGLLLVGAIWVLISFWKNFSPKTYNCNPNIKGDCQPDSGREN